jgi:hypothetical protein
MIENNFFKKNPEEELINKFGLRNTPLEYTENDAINYSSQINESADLKENPDNLIRRTFGMLPENLEDKQAIDMEGTHFLRHIVHGSIDIAGCIKQAAFLI